MKIVKHVAVALRSGIHRNSGVAVLGLVVVITLTLLSSVTGLNSVELERILFCLLGQIGL
jgi:hypothetical protein|uniref:Uncharacterized protein n=1 Tax=Leviviridae sp. TaxID=2027243 RepID=A0A514D0J3_9VIRU|nr:MAG: hypothetical protein H1Bulk28FD73_000002 [Leviviridae sp.]